MLNNSGREVKPDRYKSMRKFQDEIDALCRQYPELNDGYLHMARESLVGAFRASGINGRTTPEPYHQFPVESLPQPVRDFVRQGAAALGCDPAYLALPCLAVLGSAIGNTRVIRLKRSWH